MTEIEEALNKADTEYGRKGPEGILAKAYREQQAELKSAIEDATEWELENVTLQADAEKFAARIANLEKALDSIMCEIGVPQPDYPAPLHNAYKIAEEALK